MVYFRGLSSLDGGDDDRDKTLGSSKAFGEERIEEKVRRHFWVELMNF